MPLNPDAIVAIIVAILTLALAALLASWVNWTKPVPFDFTQDRLRNVERVDMLTVFVLVVFVVAVAVWTIAE